MGFWSTVGKVAKFIGEEVLNETKSTIEKTQQYKAEMEKKTDDELLNEIRNAKKKKKATLRTGAASQELKKRGYDAEKIKQKTQI